MKTTLIIIGSILTITGGLLYNYAWLEEKESVFEISRFYFSPAHQEVHTRYDITFNQTVIDIHNYPDRYYMCLTNKEYQDWVQTHAEEYKKRQKGDTLRAVYVERRLFRDTKIRRWESYE